MTSKVAQPYDYTEVVTAPTYTSTTQTFSGNILVL